MKQILAIYIGLITLVLISMAASQTTTGSQSASEATLPYTPSLDVTAMDKSVDPCVDLYHYSCGSWQKKNPIPPDQTSWSVYGKLYQDNLVFLRGILEEAAAEGASADAVTQKIGGFYGSCMNEAAVEKRGIAAIQQQLDDIAHLKSVHDLAPLAARLTLPFGRTILFNAGSGQDPDNSEQVIGDLDQGGLGLPDRDYYTKEDAKSKETRERYLQHVQKVFELLGDSSAAAKQNAETIMRMETGLAKASWTRVERRDPYKMKNKMKVGDLHQLAPNFDWPTYFHEAQYPKFEIVNVDAPAFYKQVNAELASESLTNWKTYLRFHVADQFSSFLSSSFVQENFEFYRKYLHGAKEQEPRWRRCVQFTDYNLSEALGQAYVRKVFSPELKASTLDMVKRIESAMAVRINQLDWMSPETKQQALAKLAGIRNKIGYPEKWRDYSAVKIIADDFAGN